MRVKGEIKLDLINHYDTLRSEVDIKAQEELMFNHKCLTEAGKQDIINLNLDLIKKLDYIFDLNCKQIDEYFTNTPQQEIEKLDKEEIKALALKHYCAFVSNNVLKNEFKNKNPLGVFIVSDWYLNQNQLDFIR
jgi:hypothetical protein